MTKVVNEKSPSFSGIVNQECKGKLWVDKIDIPMLAIAESYAVGSFAFLGAQEANINFTNLKDFLETELFVYLIKNGHECFEFSIESECIRTSILKMFQEKAIHKEKEYSFRINTVPKSNPSILHKDYQIKKVDAQFWNRLSKDQFENEDFLKRRLLESWHTFDEFEASSLAYCILFTNRIVSVMVGTASNKNIIAIDIESEEKHRRRGLAYAMAIEFIADCLNNGLIPQWDCIESNPNSYHLAKKLGFQKTHENTIYWFNI